VAVVQYTFTQKNTHNYTMKQNTSNGSYITMRIHKHNNKIT